MQLGLKSEERKEDVNERQCAGIVASVIASSMQELGGVVMARDIMSRELLYYFHHQGGVVLYVVFCVLICGFRVLCYVVVCCGFPGCKAPR